MSTDLNDLRPKHQAKVILDGRVVPVPGNILGSVSAVRDFLEVITLHQERLLTGFVVDGVDGRHPGDLKSTDGRFSLIRAESKSFFDLGKQMMSQVRHQVQALKKHVEGAMLQVVINEWAVVEKLWREWQPDLKSPKSVIGYLKKLCGARVEELMIAGRPLADHMGDFPQIWDELIAAISAEDPIRFSDGLEHAYLPWLDRFIRYLELLEND